MSYRPPRSPLPSPAQPPFNPIWLPSGLGASSIAGIGSLLLVWLGLSPLSRLSEAVSKVSPRNFGLDVDESRLPRELRPIAGRLTPCAHPDLRDGASGRAGMPTPSAAISPVSGTGTFPVAVREVPPGGSSGRAPDAAHAAGSS